jgi:hypothetical protein
MGNSSRTRLGLDGPHACHIAYRLAPRRGRWRGTITENSEQVSTGADFISGIYYHSLKRSYPLTHSVAGRPPSTALRGQQRSQYHQEVGLLRGTIQSEAWIFYWRFPTHT